MSSGDEADPAPKKMHEGYHGWMKTIPKTSQAHDDTRVLTIVFDCVPQDFTPVRIENTATSTTASTGNSVWNSAGTWEEKDKSKWACERLKELVLSSFSFVDGTHKVSIKANSIVRCDGDAKVVFSRGKKRCGYDISLKFEWVSTRTEEDAEGVEDVTGHVEVHDFDDTNGEDYEIKVTTEMSRQHEVDAKKAVLKWEFELRKILATWKDELLQQ